MRSTVMKMLGAIMMAGWCLSALASGDTRLTGAEQLIHIERLPLLRPDVQVHYEGSIDKRGKNADWDWWLYQDTNTQEWVICEAEGPGCLWNFVAHHAVGHSDPVYRFYFDGNTTPTFEIKHSEFGSKAPFVAPLADKFVPMVSQDARLKTINFQIVRSFCPMPFSKSLRITSSVRLEGNEVTGGGWGHAIWHSYPTAEGIRSFTGREDYAALVEKWKRCGEDPKASAAGKPSPVAATIPGRESRTLFEQQDEGSLSAIRLRLEPASSNLWIRITWDGEPEPAVECPLGAFFGNELGFNRLQTLMVGADKDGTLYCFWPMPFWRSARIEVENRGEPDAVAKLSGEVVFTPASALAYPRERTGHFRASRYQPLTPKQPGRDSPVAVIAGSGHVVAGLITGRSSGCEGDVRVSIDGCGSPAVQSDGSESWACYGWGFACPPQANPASSYDGKGFIDWSMLRLLMGDCYPFRTRFRMTCEGETGDKSGADRRSGVVFWYGEKAPAMCLTDFVDVGDAESEAAHGYAAPASVLSELTSALEGEFDDVAITDNGRTLKGPSQFTVQVEPANQGVILRRRSDQQDRGQQAKVFVDGHPVSERLWTAPSGNPNFRWLEDEFVIPASHTKGKQKITVRIEPMPMGDKGAVVWNESLYWVFSLGKGAKREPASIRLPQKAVPPFERAS